MAKKIFKILVVFSILSGFIISGIYLRILKPDRYAAKVYNVNAYYYYRSQHLNDFGRLPKKDIWSFAPEVFPENIPPLLAYANVGLYKIVKIFKPEIDFYDFAMFFPPIIFVFWAVFGFFIISRFFKSYSVGLFFAGLLVVMPLSFNLTGYGQYTEEGLGVFLFFFSLMFLIEFAENKKPFYFWLALFLLTGFYLTWQQFPIFVAGLFIFSFIQVVGAGESRRRIAVYYLSLIVLPLIFGHLLSFYLINIDYSPILMIYEAWLGVKNMGGEAIRTAMYRQDWRNFYLVEFIRLISFAGWVLAGAGFLKCLLNSKKPKCQIALIFSILVLAVAFRFFKSRYLALAPLFLLFCFGIDFFMERSKEEWEKLSIFTGSIYSSKNKLFFKWNVRSVAIFLIGLAIAGVAIVFLAIFKKEQKEIPLPNIIFVSLPQNLEIGKEYQIEMRLENKGEDSLLDPASFGGFHVEAENAEVKNITSWSDMGRSEVIIKPDAQREDIYWFEAKYAGFKSQEFGYLWFKIIPQKLPVNIYYRAWLPAEPTFFKRLKTLVKLSPKYRDWNRHSWRSEEVIQRSPSNNDASQELCPVKVYAAHRELQNFRCFKKELQ